MAIDRPDDDSAADDGQDAPVSDEQWAQIVANMRDLPDATPGTGPQTDAGSDDPDSTSGPAVTYPVAPWVSDRRVVRPARGDDERDGSADDGDGWRPASGRDWDASRQFEAAEREQDDQEHFVPPEPAPVFGGEPLLTVAWLAVAGMPLFWLVVVTLWRDAPPALMQASGVVFLLGLVVLIWRMPHRRDRAGGPDDSDDDGAAV